MTGPVHFIHLGGEWRWQHKRALETARAVHGAPVWVHTPTGMSPFPADLVLRLGVPDWIRHHPIGLANVKDLYAYDVLHANGGLYLDLDTISLRPPWKLLPASAQLLVSGEYHADDPHPNPCNSAVMVGRKHAPVLRQLRERAFEILKEGASTWGAIGPHLVSRFATTHPNDVVRAPYRALNGWSYHRIGDYYSDPHDPGPPCCVIHLYSSDHLEEFYADRWTPNLEVA